jgi:hypothetical protein
MLVCLPLLIGFLAKAQAEPTSTLNTTSTALTRTSSPPSDHILAIWESEDETSMWFPALVTNINGDVDTIELGLGSGYSTAEQLTINCAIEHQNQIYILGSNDDANQISRVDDCRLTRVGTLEHFGEFSMTGASCATTGNTIFMCFGDLQFEEKTCFKGSDPFSLTTIVADSYYNHNRAFIAASDDYVFVVGGEDNAETELLNVETSLWWHRTPYPYESSISHAQTLHLNGDFYVFGGQHEHERVSHIALYSPGLHDMWISRGNLLTPRHSAGVIWTDDAFLIVGGGTWEMNGIGSSEKCYVVNENFENETIECAYQNPTQPESQAHLFKVPENYCAGSNTAINTAMTREITPTLMCLVTLLQIFQF